MNEICSKFAITTPERHHWRRSGSLLLTMNIFYTLPNVSVVKFEHVIASCDNI